MRLWRGRFWAELRMRAFKKYRASFWGWQIGPVLVLFGGAFGAVSGSGSGAENGQGHLGFVKASYARRRVFPKTAGGRWKNNLRIGMKKALRDRLRGLWRAFAFA